LVIAALAWALFGRGNALTALAVSSLYYPFIDYAGYLLAEVYIIFLIPLVLVLFLVAMRLKEWPWAAALGVLTGALWSLGIAFKLVLLPGMVCFGAMYVFLFRSGTSVGRRALVAAAVVTGLLPGMIRMSDR